MTLEQNLVCIEAAIEAACRRAGRNRSEIELMAVSKTYSAARVIEAARLGLRLFGESRVQEWGAKSAELATPDSIPARIQTRTHLIGHLQSNKAQRAVETFDGIDTVDSLRLAERLNEAAGKINKRLPILLEVKLSPEESKHGLDPAATRTIELLEQLAGLTHLEPQGLMTIAPLGVSEAETRACFRTLQAWRDRWAVSYPALGWNVLSMGMSGDFALAIEEGATRIRIGTSLFGARNYSEASEV